MFERHLKFIALTIFAAAAAVELSGASVCSKVPCGSSKKNAAEIRQSPSGTTVINGPFTEISNSSVSSQVHRLEKELERIDKNLSTADPDSASGLYLRQKREKKSLELIHQIQKELINYPKRRDGRWRKMQLILHNEAAFFQDTLVKIKDFPLAKRMADFEKGLQDIKSGKEKYIGKTAKKDTVLLQNVQKLQRNLLDEYHKEEQRKRR